MPLDDVRLETARLVLRELEEGDAAAVQAWAGDPEVVRYEQWGPNTEEQTKDFLRRASVARLQEPRVVVELGFLLKSSGALIGAGAIRIRSREHLDGDIGYTLRRDAWGHGYATEAAQALVDFGLASLGLHRIWATCHVENVASARVLEKLGMKREGRLRQNCRQRGVWRDSYLYALLDEDLIRGGQVDRPPAARVI